MADGNNAARPSSTNSVFRGKYFKCAGLHMARGKGIATNVNSNNNVSVDGIGIPRHVLDLRRVLSSEEEPECEDANANLGLVVLH